MMTKERYDQFLNRLHKMENSKTTEELVALSMAVGYEDTKHNMLFHEESLYHKRKELKKSLKPHRNKISK